MLHFPGRRSCMLWRKVKRPAHSLDANSLDGAGSAQPLHTDFGSAAALWRTGDGVRHDRHSQHARGGRQVDHAPHVGPAGSNVGGCFQHCQLMGSLSDWCGKRAAEACVALDGYRFTTTRAGGCCTFFSGGRRGERGDPVQRDQHPDVVCNSRPANAGRRAIPVPTGYSASSAVITAPFI